MNRRQSLTLFAAGGAASVFAGPGLARARIARLDRVWPPVEVGDGDLAIQGHDPVAYFRAGVPTPGREAHSLMWNGAVWRFASADNRAAFEAGPEVFAPKFGGYCAWATSRGYIAPGAASHWRIVDGDLYLNFSARAQELWEADIPGNIALGEANWPRVLTVNQG